MRTILDKKVSDIRRTKTRQAALRAVKLSSDALTADQVFTQVKRVCPETGLATVYRNLEFLTKRGEVYRIDGEDGIKRYIGHTYHEATFRCQRCGKTESLPVAATAFAGQTVFVSKLVAQGLCRSCMRGLKKL